MEPDFLGTGVSAQEPLLSKDGTGFFGHGSPMRVVDRFMVMVHNDASRIRVDGFLLHVQVVALRMVLLRRPFMATSRMNREK